MPDEKDPRIIIPMSQELVDAIEEYRYENRFPSRAEAIRSLLEFALQTIAQQQTAQREKA